MSDDKAHTTYVTHQEFSAFAENVNRSFARIDTTLSALSAKLDHRAETKWGPMAAWASVIISIVVSLGGLVSWGLSTRLHRIEADVVRLHTNELQSAYHNGRRDEAIERLQLLTEDEP